MSACSISAPWPSVSGPPDVGPPVKPGVHPAGPAPPASPWLWLSAAVIFAATGSSRSLRACVLTSTHCARRTASTRGTSPGGANPVKSATASSAARTVSAKPLLSSSEGAVSSAPQEAVAIPICLATSVNDSWVFVKRWRNQREPTNS